MAPLVPSLAQSESKQKFFARLGLNPSDPVHKRVYALMKMEAAQARRRLLESQTSSTAQIHESAWQREVMRVYDDACIETKAVYNFGHDTENRIRPDNWIIRWLLWHVFRYRDYRNKGRPGNAPDGSSGEGDADSTPSDSPTPHGDTSSSDSKTGKESAGGSKRYWDPIREQWQG
ncbi:unnamed protein product [Zymoseptoria tritici ST99CH_1A5]|uniref:Uncharacterized protein n=2 Tax=Zymoseptoria tritici TaxID=1047171 RepID=F9XDE2_ZYMTI|nr:uncharacterized protein MYCGRDRAFT_93899 [Zymoseptoria tritici IPO323]EGP86818.1 hypothetical protein MYCGRDRAFT_93899 [Zymoseptoria tritici IPO323]SMR56192.1 unnamed protein product [Zymoseptoria tritici ST99CH_3D1]SMY25375.1 unnamed protein product [Zymoseptoria tritici ST99CH_1A5]